MSEVSPDSSSDINGTNIPIHLSMDDPEPMYRQIESQLRDFILGGQLTPGTKLPSVRALARDLACSVITTRRAYQDLEGEGFIRTRQGMGTIVAEIEEERMSRHRTEPVEEAFREAVKAGRRAGFDEGRIRDIFDAQLGAQMRNAENSQNGEEQR